MIDPRHFTLEMIEMAHAALTDGANGKLVVDLVEG